MSRYGKGMEKVTPRQYLVFFYLLVIGNMSNTYFFVQVCRPFSVVIPSFFLHRSYLVAVAVQGSPVCHSRWGKCRRWPLKIAFARRGLQ